MSSNGERDDHPPAAGDSLDQLIRDLGIAVTEEGKARWRERLSKPISPEALAAGRRIEEESTRPLPGMVKSDGDSFEQLLQDMGVVLTDEGRARWRERLSKPISPAALEAGRQMQERARRGEI